MLRRGNYQNKFSERFAIYHPILQKQFISHSWIWIHAVSVGEILIAIQLIECLRNQNPQQHVVLSTTTSTAFNIAQEHQSEYLQVIYSPIDFFWIAQHAIQKIRPKQLILVEAEVWPNLVWEAKKLGIPILLINARLSPRSEKYYRKFCSLISPIFRALDAICIQDSSDIEKWKAFGAYSHQLYVTGSMKLDSSAFDGAQKDFRPLLSALGCPTEAKIILGGSTHPGEEKILAQIFLCLRKTIPHLFLILAPRHTERVQQILEELRPYNLKLLLRSQKPPFSSPVDGLIIDSTGELRDWYYSADAVFIGKSLTSQGGQNPAEAIMAGKPVTFGPNMQNFETFTQMLLSEKGAVISHNEKELKKNLERMLTDKKWTESLCAHAKNCMNRHNGSIQRTIEIIHKFL